MKNITKTNIIVDGGIEGFRTINEALQAASDQTTIQIMHGRYYESIMINKNVIIIGVGNMEDILIIGKEKSAISSVAKQVSLQNLTLIQESEEHPCVDISSGEIEIEGCNINGGKNCITIYGCSEFILKNNRIHNAKYKNFGSGNGIYIVNSKGIIEQNEIFKNDSSGMMVTSGAAPVVRNNLIHKNRNYGIHLNNSNGTFEQNSMCENTNGNIKMDGKSLDV